MLKRMTKFENNNYLVLEVHLTGIFSGKELLVKYYFNTILTWYLAFEITVRIDMVMHSPAMSAINLCVAVFCNILSQVNSDHIRKSYLTGAK